MGSSLGEKTREAPEVIPCYDDITINSRNYHKHGASVLDDTWLRRLGRANGNNDDDDNGDDGIC